MGVRNDKPIGLALTIAAGQAYVFRDSYVHAIASMQIEERPHGLAGANLALAASPYL